MHAHAPDSKMTRGDKQVRTQGLQSRKLLPKNLNCMNWPPPKLKLVNRTVLAQQVLRIDQLVVRKTREFTALLLFGDDALAVVVEYQNPTARGMNTAHRRTDREQHTRVAHAPHLDMSIVDIKHLV